MTADPATLACMSRVCVCVCACVRVCAALTCLDRSARCVLSVDSSSEWRAPATASITLQNSRTSVSICVTHTRTHTHAYERRDMYTHGHVSTRYINQTKVHKTTPCPLCGLVNLWHKDCTRNKCARGVQTHPRPDWYWLASRCSMCYQPPCAVSSRHMSSIPPHTCVVMS